MKKTEHDFGGNWTLIKIELLERYLKEFNVALQNKPLPWKRFNRIFIDAFAGTGECSVKIDGHKITVDGSAKRALETNPSFDKFYFIDRKAKHIKALSKLSQDYSDKNIEILGGDCNDQIDLILSAVNWKNSRAVMFLDPYGMSVKWETLHKISETKAVDIWYLFPISAVCRQAAYDFDKVDDSKQEALTRLFGTECWMEDFYRCIGQKDLFSEAVEKSSKSRRLDQQAIVRYFTAQLKTIFPVVLDPAMLPDKGSPIFALFFISSNPSKKSINLSKKIASHILNMHSENKLDSSNISIPKNNMDLFGD